MAEHHGQLSFAFTTDTLSSVVPGSGGVVGQTAEHHLELGHRQVLLPQLSPMLIDAFPFAVNT